MSWTDVVSAGADSVTAVTALVTAILILRDRDKVRPERLSAWVAERRSPSGMYIGSLYVVAHLPEPVQLTSVSCSGRFELSMIPQTGSSPVRQRQQERSDQWTSELKLERPVPNHSAEHPPVPLFEFRLVGEENAGPCQLVVRARLTTDSRKTIVKKIDLAL